jgi:bifunctional non-homologous end joining protein LigD
MHGKGRGKDNWLLIKMKDEQARPESNGKASATRKAKRPARTVRSRSTRPPAAGVTFTNLDKVMDPDTGITKGDMIEFYRRIAPRLLPFLRDRPVTLERLPEGLGDGRAPRFWQKNTPASYPDWIARADLPTEDGKTVHYAVVNNLDTLLYLVNLGTLTFHVWFSRLEDLDRPDFVLFDLDRSQSEFADVVAVARQLHTILQEEDVEAFLKTSGKTGLHVLVPWSDAGGFNAAREWALGIGQRVVEALPEQATLERSKARRGRRVYVDVMQNARGLHAVPPYVLRAVAGAPVSTPLDWKELTADLDPAQFNLKTIFRRLARLKRDPFAKLLRAVAGTAKA